MAPGAVSDDQQTAPTSGPGDGSDRPRILVPEKLSPDGLALLRASDFQVDARPGGVSAAQLLALIPSYDGLIVRSETKVTAAVLRAAVRLRVVARAGVGVDNIDVDAATAQGVVVVNSPAGNVAAAAEHTVALLLATARHIGRADRGAKEGSWDRAALVGVEVGRKTLGVVGLGKVGMQVARMCAGGLGMRVLAVDPYASAADLFALEEEEAGVTVTLVPRLADLLPRVDFLTVHTPLTASTLDLVGAAELAAMRPAARVLNVARGGVYNEAALLDALDRGVVAGAGLDVFTSEPPRPGSVAARLAGHPRVVATPHLGASTVEAQDNVSLDVARQVRTILSGGLPTAAVNAPLISPEEWCVLNRKLQPFVRLVEKMGSLYTQNYYAGPSRQTMNRNRFELVYQGDLAGVSNTRPLFAALVKGLVAEVPDARGRDVNIVNAALIARETGIVINEVHAREGGNGYSTYASLVTLRSLMSSSSSPSSPSTTTVSEQGVSSSQKKKKKKKETDDGTHHQNQNQVIEGYVSGDNIYICKLGRFKMANFVPEGTLLILHSYDEPGKIGGVGTVLGRHGINIGFMQVASLDVVVEATTTNSSNNSDSSGDEDDSDNDGLGLKKTKKQKKKKNKNAKAIEGVAASLSQDGNNNNNENGKKAGGARGERGGGGGDNEALMILGVGGAVTKEVLEDLQREEGILHVTLVRL
ncbi:phosphoglycerate dehydrogenase [Xylariomycetidae sp. FL2044]|nr:phosphoglycerate dehydrogenase [Xylariomycetidae sp. FL2044]